MGGLPVDMDDQQHCAIYGTNRVISLFAGFINAVFLQNEMGIIKHFGSDFKTNAIVLYLVL
jgi:hypothetical protein